ncbi:MAG: hypothetical protein ACSHWW_08135 [Nonlabens sp.]|uniref:hypothetical protein n=1 Tax=Nonlabens sp. TaxID=1888209 RepID=UPI003EF57AF8
MKKYIVLLVILISAVGMAQGPGSDRDKERKMNKEKIHTLAVAYITEQLELTPSEASKLWPLLNGLRDRRHQLDRDKMSLIQEMEGKFESLTDADAAVYVNKIADLESQIFASSYEENRAQIIEIIGAKRFLKLMKAQLDFRKKMLKEYKDRRGRGRP